MRRLWNALRRAWKAWNRPLTEEEEREMLGEQL